MMKKTLGPTRRGFLGAGIAGTLGLAFSPALFGGQTVARRARACILLWLNGGPSHIDTFDPKPGAKNNGPFKAIETRVAGIRISEHLPRLAQQARHLAFLRSVTSKEADHDLAFQLMHTGNLRSETVDYPALGAVVARQWVSEDGDLPAYVALNGGSGAGAGFFGVEFAPYVIGDLATPISNLTPPEGVDERRQARRLQALRAFNEGFARRVDRRLVGDHERFQARALRLQKSPALKAFDLTTEKPAVLSTYGVPAPAKPDKPEAPRPEGAEEESAFARSCLIARKLVEHGVRFVEVTLDGWDTHTDNFTAVAGLSKQLDRGFAALIQDLAERGLLKETLVVCMGEFGRTPAINAQNGRDHWSEAFSVVLAGGGIKGGQVIGTTSPDGGAPKVRPVTVPDLYATLLATCGINAGTQYRTPDGRPIRLVDKGNLVTELF